MVRRSGEVSPIRQDPPFGQLIRRVGLSPRDEPGPEREAVNRVRSGLTAPDRARTPEKQSHGRSVPFVRVLTRHRHRLPRAMLRALCIRRRVGTGSVLPVALAWFDPEPATARCSWFHRDGTWVAQPDPVYAMTTLAQDDLPKDTDVLRMLTRHNRVQVGAAGQLLCAGVYTVVEAPETMRVGDLAALA